jgi:WD40 repeat protein
MYYPIGALQVRVYDLASMSCSYVLTGHTEIVLCLDTCVSISGRNLIVTGSKDNTVSFSSLVSCKTLNFLLWELLSYNVKNRCPDKLIILICLECIVLRSSKIL